MAGGEAVQLSVRLPLNLWLLPADFMRLFLAPPCRNLYERLSFTVRFARSFRQRGIKPAYALTGDTSSMTLSL
jgi:hypothetical protein